MYGSLYYGYHYYGQAYQLNRNLFTRVYTESLSLVDLIVKSSLRTLNEVVALIDTLIPLPILPYYMLETITLVDSLVRSPRKVVVDSIAIVDSKLSSIQRLLSQAITLVDTNINAYIRIKILDELVTLTEGVLSYWNGSLAGIWKRFTKSVGSWTNVVKSSTGVWTRKDINE